MDENTNNIEVERKFLVNLSDLPADMISRGEVLELVQTYINFSPETRVRKVRKVNDINYYHTRKLPKDNIGLSREEVESCITEEKYNDLLKEQVGDTIYKTRYRFCENSYTIEVDVYSHGLTGLAVAEVEFKSVEQSGNFNPPDWFGKDITYEPRYKNSNLSQCGMPTAD
jgi:CYTH domain-containing protein